MKCSLCQLTSITLAAVKRGEVVTVEPGPLGTAVHVHSQDETANDSNWVAWFIELTTHCVCGKEDNIGVAGDRCEIGNECGRTGCPNCQQ